MGNKQGILEEDFKSREMYIVGYKSFQPDIQKPHQMENAVRDI